MKYERNKKKLVVKSRTFFHRRFEKKNDLGWLRKRKKKLDGEKTNKKRRRRGKK